MQGQTDRSPVARAGSAVLAHVPGLVRHGSKPHRVVQGHPSTGEAVAAALRDFDAACTYPPNQAFLGGVHPRQLPPRPWWSDADGTRIGDRPSRDHAFGELMPEEEFLGLLAVVDEFQLVTLAEDVAERAYGALDGHPHVSQLDLGRIEKSVGDVESVATTPGAIRLTSPGGVLYGSLARGQADDDALTALILLENLACKATGVLAVLHLLARARLAPTDIDYVISCSEEAVGDRYQRGGGNMAKAIAAAAGLTNASGCDVKDFCAAPIPALVQAAALVAAGIFENVVVVGGGCVAKLGMKFEGHLKHGMPILEDVLAANAVLVSRDDGVSPRVRLDSVGVHTVGAGTSTPQMMHALAVSPLERLGLSLLDVDDFATELHNPEVTEPQGSGDVPARNYRVLAALARQRGEIDGVEVDDFVAARGMPGYSPTQGHIASALCYVPHAVTRLVDSTAQRVQLLAKGSLFLGKMTQGSDGMSVLLERNPQASP